MSETLLEGGIKRNLFYFEIKSSDEDPLPSRAHIFYNGEFGKRRSIIELAVALISETIKVYLRTTELVNIILIITFSF